MLIYFFKEEIQYILCMGNYFLVRSYKSEHLYKFSERLSVAPHLFLLHNCNGNQAKRSKM